MPNEPPESNFKTKVTRHGLPVRERTASIWTYMGPRQMPPPAAGPRAQHAAAGRVRHPEGPARVQLGPGARRRHRHEPPRFPATSAPSSPRRTTPGTFDSLQLSPTARRGTRWPTPSSASPTAPTVPPRRTPTTGASPTSCFPSSPMIPTGILGVQVLVRAWVPIDDDTSCSGASGAALPQGPAATGGDDACARRAAGGGGRRAGGFEFLPTPRTGSAGSASPEHGQRLPHRPRGPAPRELHRHRRRPSSRTRPSPRAWGRPSTAPRSTWGPRTRWSSGRAGG